jgi:hypothetical protein
LEHEGIGAAYLGEGDVGNNDGVHGAGGSAEGLVLVAVGVVLVLVDLAIARLGVPGHGGLADADVALRGDGGGLAAEVPDIAKHHQLANRIFIVDKLELQ